MSKVTSIRLPDEMYNKVQTEAIDKKRSITKQIEYIIEQYYKIKEHIE